MPILVKPIYDADLKVLALGELEPGEVASLPGPLEFPDGTQQVSASAPLKIAETPPADPINGQTWFESDTGKLFVYYVGPNGGAWVEATHSSGLQQTEYPPYNQGSLNAIDRPIYERLKELISVKDFGAIGDGVADDSVAIQSAINAVLANGGGTVFFPAGMYLVGTTISVAKSSVWLAGSGASDGGTWIINGTASTPAISYNGSGIYSRGGVRDMVFGQSATVSAVNGNCALKVERYSNFVASNLQVFNFPGALHDGIVFNKATQSYVSNFGIQDCKNSGVYVLGDCIDITFVNCRSDANLGTGWYIEDSQGLYFTNCTAYGNAKHGWEHATIGTTNGNVNHFYVNCIGDTSGSDNWNIRQLKNFFMTNTWGSAQSSTSNPNAVGFLFNGPGVSDGALSNCSAFANNYHGLALIKASRISITGGQFGSLANPGNGNGKQSAGSGIFVSSDCENINIVNATCVANSAYGMSLTASKIPGLNISQGYVGGNTAGTIEPISSANSVRNVNGVNPILNKQATPTLPASGTPFTNNLGYDVTAYVSGGTVTNISIVSDSGTTQLYSSTPAVINLPVGAKIVMTYSSAPTWQLIGN